MKNKYFRMMGLTLTAALALSATPALADEDPTYITAQPAGTCYNLYRHSTGFESFYYNAIDHSSDGDWTRLVVAEDGAVYLENPLNSFYTRSWLKGYKAEGDTVVFHLPQAIYREEYNGEVAYGYAYRMKATSDGYNYEVDNDSQDLKYVLRNDSLIKVDQDMLGVTLKSGAWIGYGELTSANRVVENSTLKPSSTAKVQDGLMLYLYGTTSKQYPVKVAFDGNDVYLGNLTTNMQGFWMKGTLKDGVATFDAKNYLGIDSITRTYIYACNANIETEEDPYSGTYLTPSFLDEPITFTYNESDGTLFFRGNIIINKGCNETKPSYTYDTYQHPQITPTEMTAGTPLPPIFTNYMPYGASPYGGSDGGIEFKISYYDTDGNYLNPNNLYYNLYFDGNLKTFTPDEYTELTSEMTDVPYSYKDRDFEIVDENTRRVYFYSDVQHFGVEAFYIDGDTRLGSGITTYDVDPTGIDSNIAKDKQITSVTFTDLSGRTVEKPSKGVYLRTIHYADGTSTTGKYILRR